jgi:hypothetical protein
MMAPQARRKQASSVALRLFLPSQLNSLQKKGKIFSLSVALKEMGYDAGLSKSGGVGLQ